MKVVITRDDDGYVAIWPIEALGNLQKDDGDWDNLAHKRIIQFESFHNCSKGVFELLGFTPRRGRKYVKNIIVKD